jgi:[acyl-carrier-protein] S-malonyltransferase
MQGAADRYTPMLEAAPLRDASTPIVCNVDAAAVSDREELRLRLRSQLVSTVRWVECVERLVSMGAQTLVELGPGTVLTGLARRIAPAVGACSVSTAAAARGFATAPVAS